MYIPISPAFAGKVRDPLVLAVLWPAPFCARRLLLLLLLLCVVFRGAGRRAGRCQGSGWQRSQASLRGRAVLATVATDPPTAPRARAAWTRQQRLHCCTAAPECTPVAAAGRGPARCATRTRPSPASSWIPTRVRKEAQSLQWMSPIKLLEEAISVGSPSSKRVLSSVLSEDCTSSAQGRSKSTPASFKTTP